MEHDPTTHQCEYKGAGLWSCGHVDHEVDLEAQHVLERIVNDYGLNGVLKDLIGVCASKFAHTMNTRKEPKESAWWKEAAEEIDKAIINIYRLRSK